MAKSKRPEQKIMYDVVGLFLILYFLKEMAKVWAPSWKDGVFYMTVGCFLCLCIVGAIIVYLFLWMDGTARKIRELFYYYKFEGSNGYPRFLGKSRADYIWLYGKHITRAGEQTGGKDVIVSLDDSTDTLETFYKNNREITRYRYTLPAGISMKEIGGKLEGMVQHLEREVILVYEDGKLNIIVGDATDRKFVQSL